MSLFEEFQDGCYDIGTIVAILNLCVTVMPAIKFQLNRIWEETRFEEFQDGHHGGHLGYQKGMILAILNLYVAIMPPTKFQLNPIYGSGGDVKKMKS